MSPKGGRQRLDAAASAGAAAAAVVMARVTAAASEPNASHSDNEEQPSHKKPRTLLAPEDAVSGTPVVPARPKAPSKEVVRGMGSRQFMHECIPYVNVALPQFLERQGVLASSEPMPSRLPLKIDSASMRSYKECWSPENCAMSLGATRMYEAGANLCWIDGETKHQALPCEDPPFKWLMEFDETGLFVFKKRVHLLVVMECHVSEPFKNNEYPKNVKPLGGHAYLYAWYYAVWKALASDDTDRCTLLYECALCTTVCVRLSKSPADLAELSTKFSERVRSDSQVVIDSFLTFSDKVMLMSEGSPQLADMQGKNIRYNATLMNLSMLRTVKQVAGMTPRARQLLGEIDIRFGRDFLSLSYNKLRAMLTQSTSSGRQGVSEPLGVVVEWVLETLLVSLRRGEAALADFIVETFNKTRDKPSWVAVACTQRIIVLHMQNIVSNMTDVDPKLAKDMQDEVLPKFASPLCYHATFPVSEVSGTRPEDDDEAEPAPAAQDDIGDDGDEFMASLSEKFPRSARLLAEILKKLYDGTYSDLVQKLALQKDLVLELTKLDGDLGALGKDMREMLRAFTSLEKVSAANGNAPKATLRELVRRNSEGDGIDAQAIQAEREDVWKRVGAKRKTLVTLALCKNMKVDSLTEVFNKHGQGVKAFKGNLNEAHRLFVVSCDLLGQAPRKPSMTTYTPDAKLFGDILEFLSLQKDLTDIVLAFDGLDRVSRRRIEDALSKKPCSAEMVVVYDRAPDDVFVRKSFFGAKTAEIGIILMPTNRGKLAVKTRASGSGDSATTSTHSANYIGVEMPKRSDLPRIVPTA